MSQQSNNRTVKIGITLGGAVTCVFFFAGYGLAPEIIRDVAPIDRIKLGITCLVFPTAFFLAVILKVGSRRFGNPSENPVKVVANSESMKIDLRVLSNTHEQLVVFAVNTMALSVLLPYRYLSLLPVYSGVFVVGRILFWVAYRYDNLWRAVGFAMSVLPAVLGLGYGCAVVLRRALAGI